MVDIDSEQAEVQDLQREAFWVISPVQVDSRTVPLDDTCAQNIVGQSLSAQTTEEYWEIDGYALAVISNLPVSGRGIIS